MVQSKVDSSLFQKAKVAATPMIGWGKDAGKYVRLVFSNEPKERLIGIGEKFKRALH
ncbi:MAG: hypothetical protein JSR93_02525 [Verrucomicrobia bacterium]|nr:hypothetical protein [Verrucomicrobiota bacterium]